MYVKFLVYNNSYYFVKKINFKVFFMLRVLIYLEIYKCFDLFIKYINVFY